MATKHTPGPWFVNSFQVWAEKEGKRFGTLLASLRNTHTGDTVADADAKLIAAAPELLDLLEYTCNLLDRLPRLSDADRIDAPGEAASVLKSARAVIRKATL